MIVNVAEKLMSSVEFLAWGARSAARLHLSSVPARYKSNHQQTYYYSDLSVTSRMLLFYDSLLWAHLILSADRGH